MKAQIIFLKYYVHFNWIELDKENSRPKFDAR